MQYIFFPEAEAEPRRSIFRVVALEPSDVEGRTGGSQAFIVVHKGCLKAVDQINYSEDK